LAIFGYKRVNYDEMDGDRLRLHANKNCYRLARLMSFAQISCYYTGIMRGKFVCLSVRLHCHTSLAPSVLHSRRLRRLSPWNLIKYVHCTPTHFSPHLLPPAASERGGRLRCRV